MLKILALVSAVGVAALAPAPQPQRAVLAQANAGLWEISGAPGAKAPIRQCIANVAVLAQFEHRGRNCRRNVVSDDGSSAVVHYSCGASDFGDSEIHVITPRSLRIGTQGISGGLPFNYVLQARRVGECTKTASSSSH